MLTIAEIRRAAQALETEGKRVSIPALASKLNCDKKKLRTFVAGRRLQKELNLLADFRFPGLVYASAADKIRQRGEKVTPIELARELKKNRHVVQMTLSRHSEWAERLGIVPQREVAFEKRERLYADVIYELFRKGRKINYPAVAALLNTDKSTVHKDIQHTQGLQYFFAKAWWKSIPRP